MKSGMTDHEKGSHQPLWSEVNILDKEEHWRFRLLKESASILGYGDLLLSLPSIEINTVRELYIKKAK